MLSPSVKSRRDRLFKPSPSLVTRPRDLAVVFWRRSSPLARHFFSFSSAVRDSTRYARTPRCILFSPGPDQRSSAPLQDRRFLLVSRSSTFGKYRSSPALRYGSRSEEHTSELQS